MGIGLETICSIGFQSGRPNALVLYVCGYSVWHCNCVVSVTVCCGCYFRLEGFSIQSAVDVIGKVGSVSGLFCGRGSCHKSRFLSELTRKHDEAVKFMHGNFLMCSEPDI